MTHPPPRSAPRARSASTPAADAERTLQRPSSPEAHPEEGRARAIVESVAPEVDGGRFPIKRTVGEEVVVEADVFADGHDALGVALLHRKEGATSWIRVPMRPLGNDRWRAAFRVRELGTYEYTVEAWVDPFASWRRDFEKRVAAAASDQELELQLRICAALVLGIAGEAEEPEAARLKAAAERLEGKDGEDTVNSLEARVAAALDEGFAADVRRNARPHFPTRYAPTNRSGVLRVWAERELARFSSWYELFPRSAAAEPGRHGTLRDVEARLPYVAEMGFDILYLPPIHPIGKTHRKGPNNSVTSGPEDPGSPWGIGAAEGGHTAIHPELGTIDDLRSLVRSAREHDLEIAIDVAFQASPDHPWVREHPEWFRRRPDGSIQYAENPPKKYQDIHPIDFESAEWPALWRELEGVFEFWLEQGITVFRVDNPHTKSLRFWEWVITAVRSRHPEAIFLSEAFTRPKVMRYLAKAGFTQSYTYFPWRNTKEELEEYATELALTPVREYLRPSHWVNTPDILTEYLQTGGRAAFVARLVLAATLGASYGVYGPAFELQEARPLREGSEEYLDSEKYQIRHWDLDDARSLRHVVARLNRIRREHPALRTDRGLRFHKVDNESLTCFSKVDPDGESTVLVVVNLDPHHRHTGWLFLDLHALGIANDETFQVHDLLSNARFLWRNESNYVELDPGEMPAHVFRVRRRVRSERDFDYFL